MGKEKEKEPVWTFRLTHKIAQYKQISLVEHIVFWSSQSKHWFYGYKTPKELKAKIWGKRVNLMLLIAPPNTPRESLPLAFNTPDERQTVKLSPKQKEQILQLESKIEALRKNCVPLPDKELENQYWKHIDPQKFVTAYQKAALIWTHPNLELEKKCLQVGPYFTDLYELLKKMNLPNELMRDDTQFSIALTKLLQFTVTVKENANQGGIKLPEGINALIQFTEQFLDQMIEGGNKLFGIERKMTLEEKETYTTLKSQLYDSKTPLKERLEILKALEENPLVNPYEKIELMENAIKWIKKEASTKPRPIPCPDAELIKKHLAAISSYLQKFEAEGKETWNMKIAGALMNSVKIWREDAGLSPLTQEEFASNIHLESAEIQTNESEEGKIDIQMNLFFYDEEDSFDGHALYASVENHKIKEIELMG